MCHLFTGFGLTPASPPGSFFIDALDDHIRETLPASTSSSSTLNGGDVIELEGPSESGKTALLYFLAMTTMLPSHISFDYAGKSFQVILGGRGKSVAVCDCDGFWNLRRLEHLIQVYILSRCQYTLTEDLGAELQDDLEQQIAPPISKIAQDALASLHLFRPTSPLELAATLVSLPRYHSNHMPDEELAVLMIDSLTAFPWVREQDLPSTVDEPESDSRFRSQSFLPENMNIQAVLDGIDSLRRSYNIVTFITTWTPLFPVSDLRAKREQTSSQLTSVPFPYPISQLAPPYPSPFSVFNPLTLRPIPPSAQTMFTITHHITLQPHPSSPSVSSNSEGTSSSLLAKIGETRVTAHVRTPVRTEGDLEELRVREEAARDSRSTQSRRSYRGGRVVEGRFEFTMREEGIAFAASDNDDMDADS